MTAPQTKVLSDAECAERVSLAKARLVTRHPFYATIACSLPWERAPDGSGIDTMATDGKTFYWAPAFVSSMVMPELLFVTCHEVMHCVLQHMYRLKGRDLRRWNYATDYVINDMLVKDQIGQMPKMGLLDHKLVAECNYLSEEVYARLPEDTGKDDGGGKPGPLDKLLLPKGSEAEIAEARAQMQVMVAQAAQVARMKGKLSANLERFVASVLNPQVPWADVLRRFVNVRAKVDRSYARPKRRWLGEDLYFPSPTGQRMGEIVIAVDCSGSIGQRELDVFAPEILAIHQECKPTKLHVVYFDSRVCGHDTFEGDDTPTLKPRGGGGTAFSPIFKFVDKQAIEPCCCVVLTDLQCNDFGPAPNYPVLWITNDATKAPWGEITKIKG